MLFSRKDKRPAGSQRVTAAHRTAVPFSGSTVNDNSFSRGLINQHRDPLITSPSNEGSISGTTPSGLPRSEPTSKCWIHSNIEGVGGCFLLIAVQSRRDTEAPHRSNICSVMPRRFELLYPFKNPTNVIANN